MYRLSDVARAIDPDRFDKRLGTIRGWLNTGLIPAGERGDQRAPKAGVAMLITRSRAVHIAAIAMLADAVPLAVAAPLAGRFAYNGVHGQRAPSGLFAEGETLICAWRDSAGDWSGVVANRLPGQSGAEFEAMLRPGRLDRPPLLVTVDAAAVLRSLKDLPEAGQASLPDQAEQDASESDDDSLLNLAFQAFAMGEALSIRAQGIISRLKPRTRQSALA
jgi:hypothetical protein